MADKPLHQHSIEIHQNRLSWDRKPVLQSTYRRFYQEISEALRSQDGKGVLELGSGIGAIKTVLPECITSDIFPNPWLDRTENAYKINLADNSLNGLILFDVWHHLEFPGTALKEFARVVRPGGRVVLFEPAMGLLGRAIYGLFHHEPLGLKEPISWAPIDDKAPELRYYAAQGNCWRSFYKAEYDIKSMAYFRVAEVRTYSALCYIASGGFSKPQLYPSFARPMLEGIEHLLDRHPALFATRMLVCLERSSV